VETATVVLQSVTLAVIGGLIVVIARRWPRARVPAAPAPVEQVTAPLVAPPLVSVSNGQVTIPEYLRRYHPQGEKALMAVVNEMYRRAAGVPAVADYLRDADMAALPRHFHSVLVVLTTSGLTPTLARRLRDAHSGVRNSQGAPITPAIYGAVLGVLVDVLTEAGVPEEALAQVKAMAGPLEEVICGGPLE
jgi:hypothetical protein